MMYRLLIFVCLIFISSVHCDEEEVLPLEARKAKLLEYFGGGIEDRDFRNDTPFLYAASSDEELALHLMDEGVNIWVKNSRGETAAVE